VSPIKKILFQRLVAQFGHPRGLLGRLIGHSMATRTSNVKRSQWAVELLDIQPTDRVLEVGCGPGVALAAARVRSESVVGVDPSSVMVRQARRRSGAEVHEASAERLPEFDEPFDKVLAVNTVGHWPDPSAGLARIRSAMREGADIALVTQPRNPHATAADSAAAEEESVRTLSAAGFVVTGVRRLDLNPPVVCVIAEKPGGAAERLEAPARIQFSRDGWTTRAT
jgi:SAM-dependent methyltransferase